MAAEITLERSVGLNPKIEEALVVATQFVGMKPSQYILRQATVEKLVREGFLAHPLQNGSETKPAEK